MESKRFFLSFWSAHRKIAQTQTSQSSWQMRDHEAWVGFDTQSNGRLLTFTRVRPMPCFRIFRSYSNAIITYGIERVLHVSVKREYRCRNTTCCITMERKKSYGKLIRNACVAVQHNLLWYKIDSTLSRFNYDSTEYWVRNTTQC